ncbi:hypothetical protein G6N05_05450 [Flavobacterium sp. F372]|uniref:Uncharacterized protein n=1 Tax=Flavobacterium bernardetii TaxID=2813823 RepID=A0ABR7J1A7_9FLAO|nr:hypothetical protein [Flavobacterium bernardetii]MBC5835826.1 hypothetical protein [Flavobacterium bernardetii]NHF69556.1 hypothetical protein [Flavobacterium bernardetii]
MTSTEKKENPLTLDQAIKPIVECGVNFRNQRMLLHEMFTSSVANAPDDEIENFTAKRLTPVYLALCNLLENLDSIEEIHSDNIQSCMFKNLK